MNWFLCKVRNVYLISFFYMWIPGSSSTIYWKAVFCLASTFDTFVKLYRAFIIEFCVLFFSFCSLAHSYVCILSFPSPAALSHARPPLLRKPFLPCLFMLCCLLSPLSLTCGYVHDHEWGYHLWKHGWLLSGVPHWGNWSPLPQRPLTASWSLHDPVHNEVVMGPTLWSEFLSAMDLLRPMATTSQYSYPTCGSYVLSITSSVTSPEPWGGWYRCPVCDRAEFSIPFHRSTGLFLCQYHTVFITMVYNLKQGTVVPLASFSLFTLALAIGSFLCFHGYFKNIFF